MRNRFLAVFLTLIVFVHPLIPSASAAEGNTQPLTQQQVTEALLALQTDFPEGMIWTNQSPATAYIWAFRGTVVAMSGCAAFAAIAQDQVFGSIQDAPVTWQRITKDCPVQGMPECAAPYSWDTLWPGDILKFSGHSVIVLQKYENHVTVAEGNNGGQIRWGRAITKEGVATANYVLTRYTKAEPLMPFTDLPDRSHWAYKPIIWALMENVAAPISATSFGQNGDCTRAEMISFLWVACGHPEPDPGELPFTDVPTSAPYYKAALWALQQHITCGTSATAFSPDALCTRAQALTFLWRSAGGPQAQSDGCVFDDVAVGRYYYSSVTWAVGESITKGTSATTFSPDRTITRAEALTFLYRNCAE